MSEQILKALMQLFAIIVKQDEGLEQEEVKYVETFLKSQLAEAAVLEYLALFTEHVDKEEKKKKRKTKKADASPEGEVATIDSVRVLGLCRKINKTLNQRQKIVVLVRLFELINSERKFTGNRIAIIETVADVFNINKEEYSDIETFIKNDRERDLDKESILIISDKDKTTIHSKYIKSEALHGIIVLLQVKSAELYFIKYTGKQDVYLNGQGIFSSRISVFAPGSTVRLPKGKPVYYSDVVANYMSDLSLTPLSFEVTDLEHTFASGDIGLRDVTFSVSHGKLVGIMGASGAGKSTMLNALSGISDVSHGSVMINGINLHTEKEKLKGVIGHIPQDDLLIEELTVFENLYYNAKLCFRDLSESELTALVHKTLKDLGLFDRKDLTVGNPMNKMISGGQRKRLNIALELIREPSILFVDEPTSGLSSRDSENVMDLLSELTLKGKLIFVVIHQPSSEIYKMFDRMLILDQGGLLIYYGNPIESIVYFKTIDNQINSGEGECPVCGNVTPELIFNIVEANVVDEFGQYTDERKIKAPEWKAHFDSANLVEHIDTVTENPPSTLNIPSWFKQLKIFTVRDVLSKISNKQYIILNLIESPLLGFILSFLIRYIADPASSVYIYYDNENIPPYIFMSIVVALFLGLTVSAEEIFRDRKILKREKFLNLSRSAYLMSKISILTVISAIQAILFVVIGNAILGVQGMYFQYWIMLFSVFVFANMMGLNISASFNSAVTIYILIPLLMIPQMALGGAMFSFDKLNRFIGSVDKVPLIAEFMTSRWAYEAMMVYQFKENTFQQSYFKYDQVKSVTSFKQTYFISSLQGSLDALELLSEEIAEKGANIDSIHVVMEDELALLRNEMWLENSRLEKFDASLKELNIESPVEDIRQIRVPASLIAELVVDKYSEDIAEETRSYIDDWTKYYQKVYSRTVNSKEHIKEWFNNQEPNLYNKLRKKYHNEHLDDIVRNVYEKNKILRYKDRLIQQDEPIYLYPSEEGFIGFRTHFYAPRKYFMGKHFETFWFNVIVIFVMSMLLYVPLYYEHLKRLLELFGSINLKKKKKIIKEDEVVVNEAVQDSSKDVADE